MRDTDCGVLFSQQLAKGLVDKCLGFSVEGTCSFVENKNVRLLDERTSNSDALLLATRELCATGTDMGFEAIRLRMLA